MAFNKVMVYFTGKLTRKSMRETGLMGCSKDRVCDSSRMGTDSKVYSRRTRCRDKVSYTSWTQ
jgi:hypothetical protein